MAPVRRRAVWALRVDWMYPVARKLVEETEAREDWPEAERVPNEPPPVAVMFVEETLVEETLFAARFVDETDWRLDWPPTLRDPDASRFVDDADCSDVWPDETVRPASNLPAPCAVKVPVVVAFVNIAVEAVVPPIGVLLIEADWKLPVPVAFVNVNP